MNRGRLRDRGRLARNEREARIKELQQRAISEQLPFGMRGGSAFALRVHCGRGARDPN